MVIVCSIENLDPMGVHTGDSITVAPAQTLTDKEYQLMRNAALRIIREIGVDTGGSNIQFAVHPDTGEMVIIEMNPRVSRSSALASKATGFPIAKIAAKLAVGYTLDEIRNDITRETPASFEPTIDYVVTKIPRFTFEKFPQTEDVLGTQMKSVGEVMAIGRTFKESLQKAIRSLENSVYGFEEMIPPTTPPNPAARRKTITEKLRKPNSLRLYFIGEAFRDGWTVEEIRESTGIDPWFLDNIRQIIAMEGEIRARAEDFRKEAATQPAAFASFLRRMKGNGFSDRRLAKLLGVGEDDVRKIRYAAGVRAVYKRVDTCGAEFEAHTPYLYSTYESENEAKPTDRKKVVILGGGPNRIGQGIEFDYCCVHGVFALREEGFETIMVNCNPETVSTDYDSSDRLYFEPLTKEDVLAIIEEEKPVGVIVQFGGQTPLKLAVPLEKEGVRILGTSPESIDRAEDRERFAEMLNLLGLSQPPNGIARSTPDAVATAARIGYPVLLRPSYVLGGRAMEIVDDEEGLRRYLTEAVSASEAKPVLVDRFLEDAIEIDVDAISDGETVVVGGIMEHIEEAGVHSGDSACSLPPHSISRETIAEITLQTKALATELSVIGLMNVQFAIQRGKIFILEVNPRASRTIPFVSKAIGVPLAKLAAKVMAGRKLADLGIHLGGRAGPRLRQGGGLPLHQVPRRRHAARSGNEVDRRGDGDRQDIRRRLRQGADRRRDDPAALRKGFLERARRGQGGGSRRGGKAESLRLLPHRHPRHGSVPDGARDPMRYGTEGERGTSARRGPHQERGDRPRHQHAARGPVEGRLLLHPSRIPGLQRPVLHHPGRRAGGLPRDPGPDPG